MKRPAYMVIVLPSAAPIGRCVLWLPCEASARSHLAQTQTITGRNAAVFDATPPGYECSQPCVLRIVRYDLRLYRRLRRPFIRSTRQGYGDTDADADGGSNGDALQHAGGARLTPDSDAAGAEFAGAGCSLATDRQRRCLRVRGYDDAVVRVSQRNTAADIVDDICRHAKRQRHGPDVVRRPKRSLRL